MPSVSMWVFGSPKPVQGEREIRTLRQQLIKEQAKRRRSEGLRKVCQAAAQKRAQAVMKELQQKEPSCLQSLVQEGAELVILKYSTGKDLKPSAMTSTPTNPVAKHLGGFLHLPSSHSGDQPGTYLPGSAWHWELLQCCFP